jgi:hypothetical protein
MAPEGTTATATATEEAAAAATAAAAAAAEAGKTTPAAGATAAADTGEGAAAAGQASAAGATAASTGEPATVVKPGDQTPAGPPDKYELTVPEDLSGDGFSEADFETFQAGAREQGLTNDDAQVVLDALPEQYGQQRARFLEITKAHPEIGGDKLEGVQQNARAVLDKFLPADTPEGKQLRDGLTLTGYGNWPPLIMLLNRIHAVIAEDPGLGAGVVTAGAGTERSAEDILYKDTPGVVASQQ